MWMTIIPRSSSSSNAPPASARQRCAVCSIASLPGPFDGGLTVPCGRSPVHVSSDVAELKVASTTGFELNVRLDFFVEVILFPGVHRDECHRPVKGESGFALERAIESLRELILLINIVANEPKGKSMIMAGVVAGNYSVGFH